ncbi:polysaccharide biosynthesis/export family protein [Lichenicola sp.]|uniref:polysaccharide biosynthesis/export family protein n=1 Tax=Lichenicola sp. TaxID=2804529 RepID=UPI003B009B72
MAAAIGMSLAIIIPSAGCGSFIPQSGPGLQAVRQQASVTDLHPATPTAYALITVDADTLRFLTTPAPEPRFSVAETSHAIHGTIGVGDDLGITIFESGPGGLFITDHPENPSGNSVTLPSQQVDEGGNITIPFGGKIAVVGHTPAAVERAIVQRLGSRALEPQAVVSILARRSGMISVVGDVGGTAHFSLDPGGETMMGAIARAGGPRFPDYETIVSLQRAGTVQRARLSEIVADPGQNLPLEPGDAIYISHDPEFFLAMGATGQTSSLGPLDRRIAFGGEKVTLADALARAGGLEDDRANARALFVYRLTRPGDIQPGIKIPTVYVTDLRDPRGYIYASRFIMHPEDIIFVSNAPSTDLAKFLALVLPAAYTSQGFNAGLR